MSFKNTPWQITVKWRMGLSWLCMLQKHGHIDDRSNRAREMRMHGNADRKGAQKDLLLLVEERDARSFELHSPRPTAQKTSMET